jgi:hypothetical protein
VIELASPLASRPLIGADSGDEIVDGDTSAQLPLRWRASWISTVSPQLSAKHDDQVRQRRQLVPGDAVVVCGGAVVLASRRQA